MRIRVAIRNKVGSDFVARELKRVQITSELDLERIAKECERVIQATIMAKAQNPTGHLASLMIAEKIIGGWGVGDIETLDKQAPYWNHQDKGSEGIGANWDHFLPTGFWDDGKWVTDPTGYSGVKPKTPIPAMNFISSTIQQMQTIIPRILKGIK